MLEQSDIEARLAELKKALGERGNIVISQDPQCIALSNQIQAYSAVLSPAPDLSETVVVEEADNA